MHTNYVGISFIIGIIIIGFFLIVISRFNEFLWLSQGEFNHPHGVYAYSLLPIGIFFFFVSITSYNQYVGIIHSQLCDISFLFVIVLSIFLLISPPKQNKPRWLQWLEKEYGYCFDYISKIARKMPNTRWNKLVKSQSDLQKWLDEQYEQYPKPFDQAWEHERSSRLKQQAVQDGSYHLKYKEPISGYIPEHRRKEEVERIEWENSRSKKRNQKTEKIATLIGKKEKVIQNILVLVAPIKIAGKGKLHLKLGTSPVINVKLVLHVTEKDTGGIKFQNVPVILATGPNVLIKTLLKIENLH